MANINSKEHLFVIVQGKNGLERREVKRTSSTYKITDRIKNSYEDSLRRTKKVNNS